MDQCRANNIRHGGGHSQIEFCDLYSIDRDMVHIKPCFGSGVLSHLISQAAVSGQSFKSDVVVMTPKDYGGAATNRCDFR
jgi:uncharacterized protein (TIGR04141 family)